MKLVLRSILWPIFKWNLIIKFEIPPLFNEIYYEVGVDRYFRANIPTYWENFASVFEGHSLKKIFLQVDKKPICSSGAVLQLSFNRIFLKCDIKQVISKIRNLGGIGPPKKGGEIEF